MYTCIQECMRPIIPISSSSQSNTYQAVIITDGTLSYAIFIYKCGALETGSFGGIGYYFDASPYNEEHPLSNSILSSTIACGNSTDVDYPWQNVIYWLNRKDTLLCIVVSQASSSLDCTSSHAGPEVQFSAASYTISEGQRSLNVCMVLDLDLVTPLVVDVSVRENTPVTAAGG